MDEEGNAGNERKEFAPRGYAKPVQVGDELEVTVEGKGKTGDGVAKVNGYVIFIKGETEVGQKYMIRVVRIGRNFATGELATAGSAPAAEEPAPEAAPEEAAAEETESEETESEEKKPEE
ncbi:MAG: TRAM domain-containing protein [Candidatus Micrarchaeota archaeon]|nr:TRAM domain-containing protein [Candidatus Micrarchaeota archaeon]